MSGRRGWPALGGLVVLVLVLALLRPGAPQGSPEHRSSSDAADGTSALRLLASALGHPTGALEGSFNLQGVSGLLFIFTPTTPFSAGDAAQVRQWVNNGGVLVYASERGDPQLDAKLGLKRSAGVASADAGAPAPLFGGVRRVKGATVAVPFQPSVQQVPLLRNRDARGDVLAVSERVGRGRVVALSDPLPLCNGFVEQLDNGRLAADLLALVVSSQPVAFDEFHHELNVQRSSNSWLITPWGGAAAWAVLLLAAGLALRGRPFGPFVPITQRSDRSTGEYAVAVGRLLRRAGARTLTLEVLAAASRRALAERIGLGRDAALTGLPDVLKQRAPALAGELSQAEARLGAAAAASEAAFLHAARSLHTLAYPKLSKSNHSHAPEESP